MTALERFAQKTSLADPKEAKRLRALKALAAGVGQTEAAAKVGVSVETLRRWIKKARKSVKATGSASR